MSKGPKSLELVVSYSVSYSSCSKMFCLVYVAENVGKIGHRYEVNLFHQVIHQFSKQIQRKQKRRKKEKHLSIFSITRWIFELHASL